MLRGSSVLLSSRHSSCRQTLLYQPAPALKKLRVKLLSKSVEQNKVTQTDAQIFTLQVSRSAKVVVPAKQRTFLVNAKVDYVASASDAHVLQQPLKQELTAVEVKKVFGFSNALKEK